MYMNAEKMMMQRRIDNLMERLEMVKRQRDAAVADLKKKHDCKVCKYYVRQAFEEPCISCGLGQRNWEWRGVQENGGVE